MYKDTDYIFPSAYLKAKKVDSREDALEELAFLKMSELLAFESLTRDYHNLKVIARATIKGVSDYSDLLEDGERTVDELSGMDVLQKALGAYAEKGDARDIDEVIDAEYFAEREKMVNAVEDPLLRQIFKAERELFEAECGFRENQEGTPPSDDKLNELLEQARKLPFGLASVYEWWKSYE